MRVKKRVKRGVKKGIKRVKSAPPEAYFAGSGVLVGGAAVLLLATTKRGQELLKRTVQLALGPEADERESQESDVPEEDDDRSPRSPTCGKTYTMNRPRTPMSRRNQQRTPTVTRSPRSQT